MNNNTHWYNKLQGRVLIVIGSTIILTFLLLAVYVVLYARSINQDQAMSDLSGPVKEKEILEKIQGTDNYWTGAENPKVTIVEFSDFACHYCRQSFDVIREIGNRYKGDVRIIYRDYPILTDYSINLALAARCAGEQGRFWNMHDKLFLNQGVSAKSELLTLAKQSGVDLKKFELCYDNKRQYSAIVKDLADGESLGISGTPTWYINGYRLEGSIPRDVFIKIIEDLIK